jgi:hypothetical protein
MSIVHRGLVFLLGALFLFSSILSVRANVYATDIRLDDFITAGVVVPGSSLTASNLAISYILNDNATAGVTIRIYSGSNVVKTFTTPGGDPGTEIGLNSVQWNGTNDDGSPAPPGVYTLSITAAADGYDTWTNITDDGTNFFAAGPRGVAVNCNTNSPYYGRVFVANAYGAAGDLPGDQVGILKCNADGSPADEGGFSTGGWPWGGSYYSPWKMAISADDRVYIDDFSGLGTVLSFDQTIATNELLEVLQAANYPPSDPTPELSGVCVTVSGTNEQIWMPDENFFIGSAGILSWQIDSGGVVATNDTGLVVAPVTTNSPLSIAPYDIAVDASGVIYAIQCLNFVSDGPSNMIVIAFPPYAGSLETNALWAIGSGDTNLQEAYGVAVDPTGTLLAVAVRGSGAGPGSGNQTGVLNLYAATNGQLLLNLDTTGGDEYTDVAWDHVGNLYALDSTAFVWRVYSPPGPNQSTTAAAPFIQVYDALLPPTLANPCCVAGQWGFTLQGQSNVTYAIEQSPDLVNWSSVTNSYSSNPVRSISIPFPDNQDFYRAVVSQ